jgi:hypothetical protein
MVPVMAFRKRTGRSLAIGVTLATLGGNACHSGAEDVSAGDASGSGAEDGGGGIVSPKGGSPSSPDNQGATQNTGAADHSGGELSSGVLFEASALITPDAGGTIAAAGVLPASLSIPAGAVAVDTQVTLRILQPETATSSPVFELQPAGLVLNEAAYLMVPIAAAEIPLDFALGRLAEKVADTWIPTQGSQSHASWSGFATEDAEWPVVMLEGITRLGTYAEVAFATACTAPQQGFVPCGGALSGTWKLGQACTGPFDQPDPGAGVLADVMAACGSALPQGTRTVEGTLSMESTDGVTGTLSSSDLKADYTGTYGFSLPCAQALLSDDALGCADFSEFIDEAPYQTGDIWISDELVRVLSCSGESNCSCELTASYVWYGAGAVNYTVAGNVLSADPSAGIAPADYCVSSTLLANDTLAVQMGYPLTANSFVVSVGSFSRFRKE